MAKKIVPERITETKKKPFNNINITFTKPLLVENASMSSVELKRNSKGITEIIVKAYGSNTLNAATEAKKVYDELGKEYPNA